MTYKTISVCLNEVSRAHQLIRFSGEIARDQDAHVIGVYVIPAVRIYPDICGAPMPQVVEGYRDFFQEQSAQVRKILEETTRRIGLRSEWRLIDSASPLMSDSIIEHGRESDLIIVSEVGSATETG